MQSGCLEGLHFAALIGMQVCAWAGTCLATSYALLCVPATANPVTPVTLVTLVTPVTLVTLVTPVTLSTLVTPVTLVTLVTPVPPVIPVMAVPPVTTAPPGCQAMRL